MAEYIEREALIEHIKDLPTWWADDGGVYGQAMKYPEGMFDCDDVINSVDNAPAADVVEVRHGEWNLKTHSFYADNWDESIELCVYITANCSKCGRRHPDQYEVYHKHLYVPEDATEKFRFDKESEEALVLAEFKQRDYEFAGFCPECGAKMDG